MTIRYSHAEIRRYGDASEMSRRYRGDLRSWERGMLRYALMIVMMIVMGVNSVWGQITSDYSGTYYIRSGSSNKWPKDGEYYLCPTENWAFFHATNTVNSTDNGQPFLTTHKIDSGEEAKYKWIIEKHSTDGHDYYAFKYSIDYEYNGSSYSRYVSYNRKLTGAGNDRMRIHLKKTENPSDYELFDIIMYGTYLVISPKKVDEDDSNTQKYLVVNGGNTNNFIAFYENNDGGVQKKENGPRDFTLTTGIIGTYKEISDPNAPFYLEEVIPRPTISNNASNQIVITAQSGKESPVIKYTTNDSDPATYGETYTGPFDPADGITSIKAVEIVDDEVSNVATYNLGNGTPYLIQSKECTAYYMVPGYPSGDNTPLNTSSVAGPKMEWCLREAGAVNGLQYYYIVNNSSSTSSTYSYLYRTEEDNLYLQDLTYKLPTGDAYKFYLRSNTDGSYNIYPKDVYNSLYKNKGNIEANNIVLSGSTSHDHAKWNFIPTSNYADKRSLFETISAHVSPDGDELHFYKMATLGLPDSYIVVTDGSDYAGTSTSETARNMSWELQIADHDDWLNYYHIRSAATGQYMYFTGNTEPVNTNNLTNAVEMKDLSSEEAGRYQFVLARATDADYYYIIPKSHKNVFVENKYYGIWNNTAILQATRSRAGTGINVKWKFEDADLFCVDPVITRDDSNGEITITSITNASDIFYTTNSDVPVLPANAETAPAAPTNKYAASFLPEVGTTQVKAQAVVKNDYTVSSSTVTYNLSEYTQPTITYNYDNNTITISTDEGARVYCSYGNAPSDPTIDPSVTTQTFTTDAITSTTVVKALAVKEGWAPSEIITMTVYKPTIELSASTAIYDKTDHSPTITVKDGENVLDVEKYTISFQKGGETVSECKDAGTYTVVVSDVEGDNEIICGTTTFTINPIDGVIITPNEGQSKEYGDPDPELTYTCSGTALLTGDELTGALSRAEGETVGGTYAITQGTLGNTNYGITFTSGKTFTIIPKSLGSGSTPAPNITCDVTETGGTHSIVVKQGGNALTLGTDYTKDNEDDGAKYYDVTVAGTGNYTGGFSVKLAKIQLSKLSGSVAPGGAALFVSNKDDGNFVVPDNMTAYIVTGISGNTLVTEPLDNIPDHVPVLLVSTIDANSFLVNTTTGTAPSGTNLLVESTGTTFGTAEIYLLYKGEFVLNAAGTLPAGRIYLPRPSGAPSRLFINWDETTGIEIPQLSTLDSQPPTGFWYTLDGRRLNGQPTKKGLYLREGKKVVIK